MKAFYLEFKSIYISIYAIFTFGCLVSAKTSLQIRFFIGKCFTHLNENQKQRRNLRYFQ